MDKKFFPPDWVSDAPYIYHHAFYSPGLLILSEVRRPWGHTSGRKSTCSSFGTQVDLGNLRLQSKGDSGRDHVVAFCEDGSSAVNEVWTYTML